MVHHLKGEQVTMTKLKTVAITCMAVSGLAGWALAQDNTTSAFPTPSSSSSSSSAVAAPRTGLYTSVTQSNAAADNTVDDFSRRPTLIGDKQYFAGFGGGDMQSAAYSFRLGSLNWFGAVTAGGAAAGGATAPATLRIGAGSGTSWGGGLLLAVNRVSAKSAAGENTTYFDPSGIGAFGDFNLGSSDVYGSVSFNTGLPIVPGLENTVVSKPTGVSEFTVSNHTLSVMGGWKKDATTEGTHAFNVEASYQMEMSTDETPPAPDVKATTSVITVMPAWGYILKAKSDYAVFLGANSTEQYAAFEQGSAYSVALTPNIAFQKQLGKGFEGFTGFSVTGSYAATSDTPVDGDESSNLLTGGSDVTVGLRWVKENLAFEGFLKESVLSNGPYLIGGNAGQGLFLNIGLALGI
ncbi:MAG: hypothetical protein JWO30_4910 [Fibrobacteres bacterium]|nr:hypothetical protein [Fibrobacterota bacterium]